MALIKCPECGREKVSDTAKMCPDCGFGIREYFEKLKKKDIEDMVNKLIQCPKNKLLRLYIIQGKTKLVKQIVNQYIPDINYDINEFMAAYSDRCDEMFGHSPAPKCPTCGSTNIKKLGAFYSTGFTPKYFECNNCGYMW